MTNLISNKYSINYDLEFINTKENALKAMTITNNIWNISLFFIILELFILNESKITYMLNFNFISCFIGITINYIILSKRHFLIFYINKLQRFNETKNNKFSIIILIGLLTITTIIGILNTAIQTAGIKGKYIVNIILFIMVVIGFVIKSKSIQASILKQITERDKKNKREKLQKYHDSLLIVNNLPILMSLILSFIIITSNSLSKFECIILYLFNFLVFFLSKPQKMFFLQYCPKCFQIRSLGLSAYPYCPNCKREEWNNSKKKDSNNNVK